MLQKQSASRSAMNDLWVDAEMTSEESREKPRMTMADVHILTVRIRVAQACDRDHPEHRTHLIERDILASDSLKVIVFGSGVTIDPLTQYISASGKGPQELTFQVHPERPGQANMRVEFVANGEAVGCLDREIMIED